MKQFKSGFVGLAGRTNVGKSTFINQALGQKVTISTSRSQTTRDRVNCIYNSKSSQIIFVDCPGFFKPQNLLGKKLNRLAEKVLDDSDLLLVMVDVSEGIGGGDLYVFEKIREKPQPKILLLNKIDITEKDQLIQEQKKVEHLQYFKEIIAISAKSGYNLDKCLAAIEENLPPGPQYFNLDMVTDQPQDKLVADIIREKLASYLLQELPHSITVTVSSIEDSTTKSGETIINVYADIFVEKKSQKAIVIGKAGSRLKKVGEQARKELEKLWKKKVFLQLWVKVEQNWTKDEAILNKLGYY
ncbi:MAG: GTPase Era [Actinomycetota bacterium]|nr:GTPase Era [Actinomycetota bacterium]